LLPFFSPVRRVGPDGLSGQGGLDHGSVYALPFPGDALHLVILGQTSTPEGQEETRFQPVPEVLVHGAGTSVLLLGQGLPLASGPEHIDDALKDLARIDGFASSARPPPEGLGTVSLPLGNEGLHSLPELIGYFP